MTTIEALRPAGKFINGIFVPDGMSYHECSRICFEAEREFLARDMSKYFHDGDDRHWSMYIPTAQRTMTKIGWTNEYTGWQKEINRLSVRPIEDGEDDYPPYETEGEFNNAGNIGDWQIGDRI